MLPYVELKENPRKLVSFTSLTPDEFELLLPAFVRAYPRKYPDVQTKTGNERKRKAGAGRKGSLAKYVRFLTCDTIRKQAALCNGCEALQSHFQLHLSGFTLVLDFIHVSEYLWKVANALLGETSPKRTPWMAQKTLLMLSGKTDQLITAFRRMTKTKGVSDTLLTQLNITANYFERNFPCMDYSTYLAKGWPIASGVIEGACRHFVKDRCELSGMRWSQTGAEGLLRMHAISENDDWRDFHAYLRKQRRQRLYGKPLEKSCCTELSAIYPTLPLAG